MQEVRTKPTTVSKLSDASGVLQLPPNESRKAIIIGTPPGRTTFVQIGASDGTSVGIAIVSGAQPLVLSAVDLGTGITEAITLIDSAGAQQTFAWVDFLG